MKFSVKSIAALLLGIGIVLGFSSLYLENQEIKEYNQDLLRELQDKRETSRQATSEAERLNSSLTTLRENFNTIKQRNADLRRENSEALAYMTYASRGGSSGQVELAFNTYNFGNSTAEDVTGECTVSREGTDASYNQFTVDLGNIEGRTAETRKRDIQFSESIRSSDRISCTVISCSGNCQPLEERIDSFTVNYPRNYMN
jgi:hypothetical protein